MSTTDMTKFRKRMLVVEGFLFLLLLVLVVKAIEIQVVESGDLSDRAEKEYTGFIVMKGKRGEIFDRNMKHLGTSADALSVAADPLLVENPRETSRTLARLLGLNAAELEKALSEKTRFVWVKKQLMPAEAESLRQKNIKGIFFENDLIRIYPGRDLAAQVIGFTGADGKGLEGLEYNYDTVLSGRDARITITKDGNGRLFDTGQRLDEKYAGDSLVLTVDGTIQHIAETALKDAVKENRAQSGMALVMRPGTGEVLAMAHYPEFNPNAYGNYGRFTWRNRAVTDPFEPGSTMKVFVAAAALENGFCTPTSIFDCENGAYRIGRVTVHDTHPYEWLTLKDIIRFSSNIGAVKIAEVIGRKNLYSALSAFGFGRKTEIGCPGESGGCLAPYSKWTSVDTGAIAFGQGVSVSALQLLSGVSAIANDGVLMQPLLVSGIYGNDGKPRQKFRPKPVQRVVSVQTAGKVKEMMLSVVNDEGTGTNAAVDGYSVCGKTGTAQKVADDGKGYSRHSYTGLFVGFAPLSNPELAILVVIDEPKPHHYGGVVAAPAFKKILTESFHYLNVLPDVERTSAQNQLVAHMTTKGQE